MCETTEAEVAVIYRRMAVVSWSSLYVEILFFVLFLTNKKAYYNKWWKNLLIITPGLFNFYLYYFNPVTSADMVRINNGWAFANPVNRGVVWDEYFNIYYITYMIVSMLLLVNWGRKTQFLREKKQAFIIFFSFISIMILGSITDILLPILGISIIPPMSIILVVGCISGMCYAIIKYKLMNITAENVLLNVFKLMSGGLIILDDKDEIISINKGAQNILECNEADVVNVKIDVFVQFDVTNTEFAREEVMMNTAHNKSVPVLMSCAKLYDEFGSMLGTVLSFQDITYIKNMQSELLQAHNQLEDKVAHRTKQLTDLNETLKTEIETRKMKEAKIEELAFSDQLTGLSNRRYFFIQLARDIHKANRDQKSFAVLFMDLDGFKMINDSLGHEVGDLLLIEVANILKKVLRKTDLLSRVGGDEFIVLLHYPCQKEAIVKVCEHIIRNISEPIKLNKNEVHITTSIGVSVYPHDGLDAEILIKNADIAMYKAKEKR